MSRDRLPPAVLLGADCVLPSGEVVNKVGSAHLALAARHFEKPVLVAAESLKFVRENSDMEIPREENSPLEVWADAPSGIDVANTYFEAVPAELITTIVTERDGDYRSGPS